MPHLTTHRHRLLPLGLAPMRSRCLTCPRAPPPLPPPPPPPDPPPPPPALLSMASRSLRRTADLGSENRRLDTLRTWGGVTGTFISIQEVKIESGTVM